MVIVKYAKNTLKTYSIEQLIYQLIHSIICSFMSFPRQHSAPSLHFHDLTSDEVIPPGLGVKWENSGSDPLPVLLHAYTVMRNGLC